MVVQTLRGCKRVAESTRVSGQTRVACVPDTKRWGRGRISKRETRARNTCSALLIALSLFYGRLPRRLRRGRQFEPSSAVVLVWPGAYTTATQKQSGNTAHKVEIWGLRSVDARAILPKSRSASLFSAWSQIMWLISSSLVISILYSWQLKAQFFRKSVTWTELGSFHRKVNLSGVSWELAVLLSFLYSRRNVIPFF